MKGVRRGSLFENQCRGSVSVWGKTSEVKSFISVNVISNEESFDTWKMKTNVSDTKSYSYLLIFQMFNDIREFSLVDYVTMSTLYCVVSTHIMKRDKS